MVNCQLSAFKPPQHASHKPTDSVTTIFTTLLDLDNVLFQIVFIYFCKGNGPEIFFLLSLSTLRVTIKRASLNESDGFCFLFSGIAFTKWGYFLHRYLIEFYLGL